MADLKLKQNGLRFLDSRSGDILLADSRLEMQLLLTSEFLTKAKEDPQKMTLLGHKLLDFLERHTIARWRYVEKTLEEIKRSNEDFVSKYVGQMERRTIDDLRKCEKDIYFYQKENANPIE